MTWPARILLALILVVASVLAGALIRGKNGATVVSGPTTTVESTTTTTRSAPTSTALPEGVIRQGCAATGQLGEQINQAVRESILDGTGAPLPNVQTGPGTPYEEVSAMGESPTQLGQDVLVFESAWNADFTSTDVSTVDSDIGYVQQDCASIGYAPSA